jgi:hypothetical protein
VVTPTVNTTYTVVGTNGCGFSTKTISIVVNANPVVSAYSSSATICSGQSAVLSASTTATSYTWSTGSNSMSIVVNPTVTTTYTVTVSSAAGCKASATVTQTVSPCTGINGVTANNAQINFYPNPNNGEFTLITGTITNAQMEIYNTLGTLVLRQNIKEPASKIKLGNVADGVYYIRVIAENQKVFESKLIKN